MKQFRHVAVPLYPFLPEAESEDRRAVPFQYQKYWGCHLLFRSFILSPWLWSTEEPGLDYPSLVNQFAPQVLHMQNKSMIECLEDMRVV